MTEQDNNKNRIIFVATFTEDKKVRIEISCPDFPVLSYAYKLLGLHIDSMIIGQNMPKPKIVKATAQGLESLKKFLDGRK